MNNTRGRMVIAAVVVAAAAMLSGCAIVDRFLPSSQQPVRDPETGEVTEQVDNADVFAIRVGDCLNTSEMGTSSELTAVPVVPCGEPHEDEVYHSQVLPEGDFPGEDAILSAADATCVPAFATFIGMPLEQSALDYWPMYPTAESWRSGDREVLCLVWDPSGAKVTGTLAGAAR